MSPQWSTAAQNLVVGHETPVNQFAPGTGNTCHDARPCVGWVEVTTNPLASTPTQKSAAGQEIDRISLDAHGGW